MGTCWSIHVAKSEAASMAITWASTSSTTSAKAQARSTHLVHSYCRHQSAPASVAAPWSAPAVLRTHHGTSAPRHPRVVLSVHNWYPMFIPPTGKLSGIW